MSEFLGTGTIEYKKTEDQFPDQAVQYLQEKYGEEGLQFLSVLDLGCGAGGRMLRLSELFSSVTGLEPDQDRCDEAMERILDQDLENATALGMDLDGYIAEFPNQTFDVVLCSGLLQHMKHETACHILENLKHVIGPDSVCLFGTTFTDGRRNAYTAEVLQEDAGPAPELDEKGFSEAVDDPDKLAVCLFARPWMERFLTSCGLDTKQFHSQDQGALYICEPAEGTLLRRSCGPETASGKICFMHFYYLNSAAGMNTARLRNLQADEAEDTDEIKDAFDTAERYLFANGFALPAQRHFRKAEVRCDRAAVADSCLVVSFYPENGVAQVSVCLTLENAPCDDFVYLRQIQESPESCFTINGTESSIPQLCEDVLKECGLRSPVRGPVSVITELNRFGNCTDPVSLSIDEKRCLYGILTGDESYLHVPAALVEEHMADSWSGLDFVRVIASGNSFLMLNFNRGETYADYVDYEIPYAERYFDGLNGYFTMDAPAAGLCHGLFFPVEKGQLLRTVAQRAADGSPQREEMADAVRKLEQGSREERGALDSLVMRELGISGLAENMRSSIIQADSEQALRYRKMTNRMVTALAILGAISLLIQIFGSL